MKVVSKIFCFCLRYTKNGEGKRRGGQRKRNRIAEKKAGESQLYDSWQYNSMGWDGEGKGSVLHQKSKQKSSKNGLNKGKMNEIMRERLTQRQCFWVLLILFLINRQNREGIVQVAVIFLSF